MQHNINTSPISQFAQLLRAAELGQQREIKMSIQQARLLGLAHTEILEKLNQNNEELIQSLRESMDNQVVSFNMDGGGFGKG